MRPDLRQVIPVFCFCNLFVRFTVTDAPRRLVRQLVFLGESCCVDACVPFLAQLLDQRRIELYRAPSAVL